MQGKEVFTKKYLRRQDYSLAYTAGVSNGVHCIMISGTILVNTSVRQIVAVQTMILFYWAIWTALLIDTTMIATHNAKVLTQIP